MCSTICCAFITPQFPFAEASSAESKRGNSSLRNFSFIAFTVFTFRRDPCPIPHKLRHRYIEFAMFVEFYDGIARQLGRMQFFVLMHKKIDFLHTVLHPLLDALHPIVN